MIPALLVSVAAAWAAPAAVAPAAASGVLEQCRVALPTAASPYEGWRCFYMAARRGEPWEAAERAVATGAANGDTWAEVVLGHMRSDRGDPAAEASYRRALEAFARTAAPAGEAQARFGLANFEWHRGAGATAVRAILDQALIDAGRSGDPQTLAAARAQLARHLWRTGQDYDAAWTLARQAEAIAFPDGPYQTRLLVLHVLAGITQLTARAEEELDFRLRMVELAHAEGDAYVEATARLNVAQAWLAAPDDAPAGGAEREARAALEAASRSENDYSEAGAWCTLARALGPGAAEAGEDWQRCADGYHRLGAPEAALYGLAGLATVQARTDPPRALATADAAVAEALASGAWDAEIDARLVAAGLRWQAGRPDARAAAEDVLTRLEATRAQQESDQSRAGLAATRRLAYDLLAARLADAGDGAGAFAVLERQRAHELRAALSAAAIGDGAWGAGVVPDALAQVQSALAADEVLVSFELPPGQTLLPDSATPAWADVITRAAVKQVPLPAPAGLGGRVAAWVGLLARRDGAGEGTRPAVAWLDPVVEALPAAARRVVVVADGPLHRVPTAGAFGVADGRPRAVSVVPSAAVWLRLRALPPLAGPGVLGVADPALPGAEAEVDAAVGALGGRRLRLGEATAAGLIAAGPAGYRFLHLAAHARADVMHPERSELRLRSGGGESATLRPAVLAALGLRGQAVLLSACSGTDGRVVDGEGVFGLARSLLAGGARVVVGSRWALRDDESSAFSAAFIAHLGEGAPVDAAVAAAQADRAAAGAPYAAWGGFVAMGDGSVVPFPEARAVAARASRWAAWRIAAAAFCLGGGGVLAWLTAGAARKRGR